MMAAPFKLMMMVVMGLTVTIAASNLTICIFEEEPEVTEECADPGTTSLDTVDSLLKPRIADLSLSVSLAKHLFPAAYFPWLAIQACDMLNSSCVGVVSLASRENARYIDEWAKENVIPNVIVPLTKRALTSPYHCETVARSHYGDNTLLPELLLHLGWTRVSIIVDSRNVVGLVKRLSDVYLGSLLVRLFEHQDNSTSDSHGLLYSQHVKKELMAVKDSLFKNVMVVASANNAALVMKEAHSLGLLSRDHSWVISLPAPLCTDLMAGIPVNDTNVLIVQPTSPGPKITKEGCLHKPDVCQRAAKDTMLVDESAIAESVEVLVRAAVQTGYLELAQNMSETSSICDTEALCPRSALVKILNETHIADREADSGDYSICSTENGSPNGLVSVGAWTSDKGLQLTVSDPYRNTFRGFGFATLRVGTQEAKPFVQKKASNSSEFEGFCVDILNELANSLQFNYVFVEPSDGEWGAPKDELGNWTGIIQQVLRKEVDFGIGPFTITSIREEVIDFTKPFMEDGVGILTQRPDSDAQNMFKMFTPLTPPVWGAVAGCVALVSVCLYFIEMSSPFSARNLEGDRKLGLLGCAWLIYGSYMEQGGEPHPRSVSARCLVGFWWLFTILMTSTYTANLAAFLTVTIEDSPVNSLSELAATSDLKPLVKQGSNVKTLFEEADRGVYHEIWTKMASGMPTVKSNAEALQFVLGGSHAYMTDASQLEYIMLKDCTTYSLAKELFNTGGFGFVLREDSPYMDIINYNIMKMQEAGLMDKWRQVWWSSPDPCTTSARTSAAKELDWSSLSGLFYIFLGVASFSVLCRIVEYMVHGHKLTHLWDRLKTVVRRAASAENTERNQGTAETGGDRSANTASTATTRQCSVCSNSSRRTNSGVYGRSSLKSRRKDDLKEADVYGRGGEGFADRNSAACRCTVNIVSEGGIGPEFKDFDSTQ